MLFSVAIIMPYYIIVYNIIWSLVQYINILLEFIVYIVTDFPTAGQLKARYYFVFICTAVNYDTN